MMIDYETMITKFLESIRKEREALATIAIDLATGELFEASIAPIEELKSDYVVSQPRIEEMPRMLINENEFLTIDPTKGFKFVRKKLSEIENKNPNPDPPAPKNNGTPFTERELKVKKEIKNVAEKMVKINMEFGRIAHLLGPEYGLKAQELCQQSIDWVQGEIISLSQNWQHNDPPWLRSAAKKLGFLINLMLLNLGRLSGAAGAIEETKVRTELINVAGEAARGKPLPTQPFESPVK